MDTKYLLARQEKRETHRQFDVEHWSSLLADISFETECFPISRSTAKALVAVYRKRFGFNPRVTGGATLETVKAVRELEQRIDDVIAAKGWREPSGAFVRLSQRSPKDGTPLQQENPHDDAAPPPEDPNDALVYYFHKSFRILRVTTGKEAMALITSSERVFCDLLLSLDAKEASDMQRGAAGGAAMVAQEASSSSSQQQQQSPHPPKQQNDDDDEDDVMLDEVAVRKWHSGVLDELEFRMFVCGGELTAASQYNDYVVYARLLDPQFRQAAERKLKSYWQEQIAPRMQGFARDYVVDVALLLPSSGEGSSGDAELDAVVIEINPFARSTGAGVFNWTEDDHVLHNGPYSLRVREQPLENVRDVLTMFLTQDEALDNNKEKSLTYDEALHAIERECGVGASVASGGGVSAVGASVESQEQGGGASAAAGGGGGARSTVKNLTAAVKRLLPW